MEHKPGDILAVHVALDGQNLFELGIVEKVENDAVAIWYLGTQGENINTARFHPVWACMKYNPIVYMLQEKQPAAYEQPKKYACSYLEKDLIICRVKTRRVSASKRGHAYILSEKSTQDLKNFKLKKF